MTGTKTCSHCGEIKTVEEFSLGYKGDPIRRQEHCKECFAAYYVRNRDRIKAQTRAWKLRNPEHHRLTKRQRESWKRAGRTGRVSFRRILERDAWTCHICGLPVESLEDLHFDHIIPLSKGGAHTADNLAVAHGRCNMKKKAKLGWTTKSPLLLEQLSLFD